MLGELESKHVKAKKHPRKKAHKAVSSVHRTVKVHAAKPNVKAARKRSVLKA